MDGNEGGIWRGGDTYKERKSSVTLGLQFDMEK